MRYLFKQFNRFQEVCDGRTKESLVCPESISNPRPVEVEDSQSYDIKEEQIEYLEVDESHIYNEDSQSKSDEDQPGTS